MFPYFGSKGKLVHLYPRPQYDLIVEPFCGSARYALEYKHLDVWINDVYPTIYEVWLYLRQATKKDIRALPVLKQGESINDHKQLCQEERSLLGFCTSIGATKPGKVANKYATMAGGRERFSNTRNRLLDIVGQISHWKITCLPYDQLPDLQATWYIDPPYQNMGKIYVHGSKSLNFDQLGIWCKRRHGQIIVCEGNNADWLPFSLLRQLDNASHNNYDELIWYRSDRTSGFGFDKTH